MTTQPAPRIVDVAFAPNEYSKQDWDRILEQLRLRIEDLERAASKETYTPDNVTTTRSYDADATTLAELADVVGTLITDLSNKGVI